MCVCVCGVVWWFTDRHPSPLAQQPMFYHKANVAKNVTTTCNTIKSVAIRLPRQVDTPKVTLQGVLTFELVALVVVTAAEMVPEVVVIVADVVIE